MGIHAFTEVARQRSRIRGRMAQLRKNVATAQDELAELEQRLAAHDAVLRDMGFGMDPDDFPPVTPTRKLNYFKRGELPKRCLDAMRRTATPMTTEEILHCAVQAKDVRFRTPKDRCNVHEYTHLMLHNYATKGLVVKVGLTHDMPGALMLWVLPQYANKWR